jgi:general secretion pathway protein L
MSLIACAFAPSVAGAATDGDDFRFALVDADAPDPIVTGAGLSSLLEALGDRTPDRLHLLLPASSVLATRVRVPARSRRQLETALPFVVEEYLAEDIEGLHLARGERDRDGLVPVRVLQPALLRSALDALAAVDLIPDRACSEADLLPEPARDEILVRVGPDRALLRSADAAIGTDRVDLLLHLQALVTGFAGEAEAPIRIRVEAGPGDAGAMDLAELEPALSQQQPVEILHERLPEADLEAALARALAEETAPGVDLLSGPFRPARRSRSGAAASRWRLVAGLLLGWFLVETAFDAGRAAWYEARAAEFRAESVAAFRELFPDRSRIPDPRRELAGLIEGGSGSDGSFMELLGGFSARVAELGLDLRIRSLDWNARRGDLAIDLEAPDIGAVDRLKDALEANGHAISIDSAVQEEKGVRARLRLGDPT